MFNSGVTPTALRFSALADFGKRRVFLVPAENKTP